MELHPCLIFLSNRQTRLIRNPHRKVHGNFAQSEGLVVARVDQSHGHSCPYHGHTHSCCYTSQRLKNEDDSNSLVTYLHRLARLLGDIFGDWVGIKDCHTEDVKREVACPFSLL